MRLFIFFLSFSFISSNAFAQYNYSLSKNIDKSMRKRVNFWIRVYTEINSHQAFIHDRDNIQIIYKKVNLSKRSTKARFRSAQKEIKKIQNILNAIVSKQAKRLTKKEMSYYKKLKTTNLEDIRLMAKNVRAQYGLKDNYYIGLQKSYLYLDFIQSQMESYQIPKELAFLPHVESSFNYQAYSRVGAAGIWQFMRGTAKNYGLKVTYSIDERRDVFKATKAAVKLLKYNYSKIKDWPLAITAYNHGLASVQRAVKKVKTKKISEIIKRYKGRRFGFASKNFYATFIATVEISKNPKKYFKSFKKKPALSYSTLSLPKKLNINQISEVLNIETKEIKRFNPSIRSHAYSYSTPLPKKFALRISKRSHNEVKRMLKKLREIKNLPQKKVITTYKVRRGDNLYSISKKFGSSIKSLIHLNHLENPSKIFKGMKLKIKIPQIKRVTKKKKENVKSEISLEAFNLSLKKVSPKHYTLTVQADETLGHYADWSKEKIQKIRNLNKLKRTQSIILGQKIKIPLTQNQKESFTATRTEYHIAIQEDFYQGFKVDGVTTYKVKSGDNIDKISRTLQVPIWKMKKMNAKKISYAKGLLIGQKIKVPVIVKRE